MRITLQEAGEKLQAARSVVITAHVNPDGDAIGSSLGLCHYLKNAGKQARVLLQDPIPENFFVLPGAEKIQEVKDLAEGEIVEADLLVILDAEPSRADTVPDRVRAAHTLNIDHHITNDETAEFLYLEPERAATCEIIYVLLSEVLQAAFTKPMALALYTGMATDTGFFRFSNTKPRTMRAAADLIEKGAEPRFISEAMEAKPYPRVIGMARAIGLAEIHFDGKLVALFLGEENMEGLDSTEGLIDMIRVVEGTDTALLMKYVDKDIYRVSIRSKRTDVTKIAEQFDGGGHPRAAGCTLRFPFAEAKAKILDAIGKEMGYA
ncbi:bifunctional oligoribonuclease/PAP phosphatase NrnA [Selenomonas sp. TAMA-11512]|uniref:DHH family phosphoesterase n=1 Tax=Selenomonas sp. TAMA-11512 TaxID=3095337 RepID=UPI00308BE457|nr:bifunctional oligoribonuclease/PAP phosphatase NrnA [Selenomonas sp. TAMA-11512]